MDLGNLSDIQRWRCNKRADGRAKVMLFGEFSGTSRKEVVEDPYYIGRDSFKKAFEQCQRFSNNFLAATFPHIPPSSR
jgi:low molecular weight phosphotyrosine protein phosphatase